MGMPVLPFFRVRLLWYLPSQIIENPQTIGEHLRKRRLQLKLLQKDVAVIFGVCEDTITGWENDRYTPQMAYYPEIIQFLGYSPFQTDTSTLGGRMKKYRIENGLSQEDLGKLIGVNESTIYAWEKGQHKPMRRKLRLLENVMYQQELSK